MRRILFIINPAAGQGAAKKLIPLIQNTCNNRGVGFEIRISSRAMQITDMVKAEILKETFTDVVAVGGDGTVVETINGIVGLNINFGLIPAGSGNDLARSLEIPKEFEEALEIIFEGQLETIDLGLANNNVFVNSAGIGIDGVIIYDTARIKSYVSGSVAYLLGTLKSIVTYKPFEAKLTIDGVELKTDAFLIAIGNGKYFGGGMKITPGAELSSGEFEVCLLRKLSKQRFLRLFPSVYKGIHTNVPEVEMFNCKELIVEVNGQELHVSADGNLVSTTPAKIELSKDKLKIWK